MSLGAYKEIKRLIYFREFYSLIDVISRCHLTNLEYLSESRKKCKKSFERELRWEANLAYLTSHKISEEQESCF